MLTITQLTSSRVSLETGFLIRKLKSAHFFFAKRAFELRLEGVLRAAAGHEGNSLPFGDYRYQLLSTEANSICTEFAHRWALDVDLLKARIPGIAKLAGLSVPPPTKNYSRLACFGMIAIPLALLLMGAMAGLASIGFHIIVGGR